MGDFVCVKNDRIERYPLAASQTIAIGDPVAVDANGYVVLADATSTPLLGVAARDCTSSAEGDEMLVYDDPDAEFECQADNVAQVLQAEVGDTCDLVVSSSTFYANLDATAVNVLKVLAIGQYMDPLRDGSTYYGSVLAGDWTPGWQSKNKLRVKIAQHV